jgi:hypothetical protein
VNAGRRQSVFQEIVLGSDRALPHQPERANDPDAEEDVGEITSSVSHCRKYMYVAQAHFQH